MHMKRVLITGGAGFIGTNFINILLEKTSNLSIHIVDKLTYAGNFENVKVAVNKSNVYFHQVDINDTDYIFDLIKKNNLDTLVNFAAESHVDRSISDPDSFIKTNINGTFSLLQACFKAWEKNFEIRRFHHVSTDEVYGELQPDELPFEETNPYLPRSPYSASKASSDHLVRSYHTTYGLPITISNCSNNYGPYQYIEKLIPLTITNLLTGKKVPVYGDGENIRDWIHVDDHCTGIINIINSKFVGETFNIGGGAEKTNINLIKDICERVDDKLSQNSKFKETFPNSAIANNSKSFELIKYVKDRLGHDKRYAINSSKICDKIGYKSLIPFTHGIDMTIDWYINNADWWQK